MKSKILSIVVGILFVIIAFGTVAAHSSPPTYVLLIHGYSMDGSYAANVWQGGLNIYQTLVNHGYIVGLVSYYGVFSITFSNGLTFKDPNFYGTQNTPIENVASELGYALTKIFGSMGPVNLDIVAHSMGGLVTLYMLENYKIPNVNLVNVIYIASPFNGSPFASIASYLGLDIFVGYQADEMVPGSSFLNNLHYNLKNAIKNYPSTTFNVYIGTYDPWWGYVFFSDDNDGVVDYYSAIYVYFKYVYTFPNDVHTYFLDNFTWKGICYFEDSYVLGKLLNNLSGKY